MLVCFVRVDFEIYFQYQCFVGGGYQQVVYYFEGGGFFGVVGVEQVENFIVFNLEIDMVGSGEIIKFFC